jgi:ComF family protein
MDVLGIFFPKKCVGCKKLGAYICTNCFAGIKMQTSSICGVCGRYAVDGLTHPRCRGRYTIDGTSAALVYRGIVKKLVYQYKFAPHLFDLSEILCDFLYESAIQQESLEEYLRPSCVITSVPLYRSRHLARGYNQSELLAKNLAKRVGVRCINASYKVKDTSSQVGKTEQERRDSIKGAIVVRKVDMPKRILIIDDVLTSGATMNEMAKVLKKNGAKYVWGLALAHGE